MEMFEAVQFAQIVVAASVSYALYITFFKPKAGEKQRLRQGQASKQHAAKQIVRQRSERWAA